MKMATRTVATITTAKTALSMMTTTVTHATMTITRMAVEIATAVAMMVAMIGK